MNRGRIDAESVRDSVLSVAGKLDLTMGGPAVRWFWFKDDHSPVYDYARFDPDGPGAYRRSIYRFIVRSVPDPFMERLDCPDPSVLTPKRSTTLTAIQALAMLNNAFVVRMSEHFAERLRQISPGCERTGQCSRATHLRTIPYGQGAFDVHGLRETTRIGESLPRVVQHKRISFCRLIAMDRRSFLWNWGGGLGGIALGEFAWTRCACPIEARVQWRPSSLRQGKARRAVVHVRRRQPVRHVRLQAAADQTCRRKMGSGRKGRALPKQPWCSYAEPVGMEAAWPMRKMGQRFAAAYGDCVDDIAFLQSLTAKSNVHGPATFQQNTGFILPGFPSAGSWISYALGSVNENLPVFVVLPDPRGLPPNGAGNWSSGFLPASHQATTIRVGTPNPIEDLRPPASARFITKEQRAGWTGASVQSQWRVQRRAPG